ncbi:hypothetical protein [Helicobacter bizzozeronii]|nr:hypothetical protein [Helicobacter bizzozeronii]
MAIGSVDIQGATVYVYDEHKRSCYLQKAWIKMDLLDTLLAL